MFLLEPQPILQPPSSTTLTRSVCAADHAHSQAHITAKRAVPAGQYSKQLQSRQRACSTSLRQHTSLHHTHPTHKFHKPPHRDSRDAKKKQQTQHPSQPRSRVPYSIAVKRSRYGTCLRSFFCACALSFCTVCYPSNTCGSNRSHSHSVAGDSGEASFVTNTSSPMSSQEAEQTSY